MSLGKAFATVGGLTLLSRITGFIRDILTAFFIGAGPIADAFFVALKLPNFFRRVTAEGALTYAFIPLYTQILEKEDPKQASLFVNEVFTLLLVILTVISALVITHMASIIPFLAPGFEEGGERFTLAVIFSQITFTYLLFMSLTALIGGVLNAHDRFMPFAATAILFNITLITALVGFGGYAPTMGHALSWGVFVAGLVQFIWIMACHTRAGLAVGLVMKFMTARVKKLLKLMVPATIGAGVTQINLFIDVILASFLPVGAVSYLYYADRLNQLPLGVVGVAVGTALLPMLSRALAADNHERATKLFHQSLEFALILALPASVGLFVLAPEIIMILFERGSFGEIERTMTAAALQAYVIGMPAYIAIKVFNVAYFSKCDTKTPVYISVIVTFFNIALSLILIQFFDHVGIALATGISGWIHVAILLFMLLRSDVVDFQTYILAKIIKMFLASIVMIGGLYGMLFFAKEYLYHEDFAIKITLLAGLIFTAVIIYAIALLLFKVTDVNQLKANVKRR